MAMIKMSPEEIRAKSQSYGQGSEQIHQILADLTRAQGEIAANWEGQAFSRFEEQFQQLSPKVEKFAQLLEEIKQQLNSTADAVQEQDQQQCLLRIISLYIDIEGVSPLRFISIGLEREKKHDKEKLDLSFQRNLNHYCCYSRNDCLCPF